MDEGQEEVEGGGGGGGGKGAEGTADSGYDIKNHNKAY